MSKDTAAPQTAARVSLETAGVDGPAMAALAERHAAITGADAAEGPSVLVFADNDAARLDEALAPPRMGGLELPVPDPSAGDRLLPWVAQGGAGLSLTAATAYRDEVARHVADALVTRAELSAETRDSVELALQEAIANAVFHGSLEVDPDLRDSAEGFKAFVETVDARLEQPEYGGRRVDVLASWAGDTVEFAVLDRGPGYSGPPQVAPNAAHGRGLALIAALARHVGVEEGGRRLVMRFQR